MASKGQPRKPDQTAINNERNQYIPSFIANKPFYVPDDSGTDYLEHQRIQKQQQDSKWYDRGAKKGPAATKFRKGACENCGAMTHKAKDCLSRPRKAGAKWTGKDIQADEIVQDVNLGWDAKRDRWNGYDTHEYQAVIEDYNSIEAMKKTGQADDEKDGEGDRYEEETDMGRQQSTSTRNLRLREDTAKYLLNLDLDSAKYDPKTRSMVDSGVNDDQAAALVAEEGFVRKGGDAAEFEKAQRYAWERQELGDKIHLQANPTAGAIAIKKEKKEVEERKAAQKKALLEKYGGQEHMEKNPLQDSLVTESEKFIEYDESGGIKGAPKIQPKSKYAEDVLINNHTSVWGSWWSDFNWGYECCHSTVKNSYCTGDAGKAAFEDERRRKAGIEEDEAEDARAIEAPPDQIMTNEHADKSGDIEQDEAAKRKRTLVQMTEGITEAEMDNYRRKRTNAQDPMANYLGNDQLL